MSFGEHVEAAAGSVEGALRLDRVMDVASRTQGWVRFLAVLGWISAGIMVVIGVLAGAVSLMTSQPEAALLFFTYPVVGLLYGALSLLLFQYGTRLREFARAGDVGSLEAAFDAQRLFWKIMSVVTIAALALAVVGILVGVLLGVATAGA